jgi:GT2 family glycosyltransferase
MTVDPAVPGPSLAILICTANRPELLRRCLAAIMAGEMQPSEVLVSDDGREGLEADAACAEFPGVRYFRGPRRGLCANRNAVIHQARSDFVSLLDDDAIVSTEFVRRAFAIIADLPPRTLVTGRILEAGRSITADNVTFLGYFGKPPDGRYDNINLNCNLIPRGAFANASFDETIFYGYEDMDVCTQLRAQGYVIRFNNDLVNTHAPPQHSAFASRERYSLAERARFYTSVKRYLLWERSWPKLLAFIALAPGHRALHDIKTRRWFDLPGSVVDIVFALRATLRERARLRRQEPARS